MNRPIICWHQDELGDWVAELACGHGQHVRHAPPLSFRPWVLTPEGRMSFVGYELNCVRCEEDMGTAESGVTDEGEGLDELTTTRLLIRPFVSADLEQIHRILNAAFGVGETEDMDSGLADRRSWLEWSNLSARWLPAMHQPPYGDRAVVLRDTRELIGAVGYVPLLMPFDLIPQLARTPGPGNSRQVVPEVGLFWAIDPAHQRRGYAAEAGAALIDHALDELRLWRIVATTEYDNHASQAVMRKLDLTLTHNPHREPEWMQVVGVRYATRPLLEEGLLT